MNLSSIPTAMVQAPTKSVTLDDFLKLPETKPASEFIDGQIIQKPMPQGKHSTVQLDLGSNINLAIKPQRIARAYTELRCTYPAGSRSSVYGGRSIVPDVTVVIAGNAFPAMTTAKCPIPF